MSDLKAFANTKVDIELVMYELAVLRNFSSLVNDNVPFTSAEYIVLVDTIDNLGSLSAVCPSILLPKEQHS